MSLLLSITKSFKELKKIENTGYREYTGISEVRKQDCRQSSYTQSENIHMHTGQVYIIQNITVRIDNSIILLEQLTKQMCSNNKYNNIHCSILKNNWYDRIVFKKCRANVYFKDSTLKLKGKTTCIYELETNSFLSFICVKHVSYTYVMNTY